MAQGEPTADDRRAVMDKPPVKVGVDTGGTFTDFVLLDSQGRIHVHKELSTPADPSRAILQGLDQLQVSEEAAVVRAGSTGRSLTWLANVQPRLRARSRSARRCASRGVW